jgi:methionyl-tRNA synthetase
MVKNKFYLTTAIDYVNAKPHMGHAFEKVLADTLARYKNLLGYDVFFLTGVDENAQKNVEAAQKAGIPVKEFIDKNAASFIELCKKLDVSYDDFIRTTAREHAIVVQKIVKKMIEKGDIYKGMYEGLYCVGCETYYTEKDLIDGKCPEHNTVPELRREEAYFFKLSRFKTKLLKIIPNYVIPEFRANEILARIKDDGLEDVCISRKGAKWGIDIPGDSEYKIWVWIDALINYISGLRDKEKKYWPADVHIIGKGINWFHSVIWPAMLLSAGYELPKKLMVHGYLNIGGKKMSKSIGNVIDPLDLLDKYPSDVVRYSLLKCSVFDDSDYSEDILIERNNNELANKLGNLVMRVSTLAEKYGLQKTPIKSLASKYLQSKIVEHMENLEFDKALNEIFAFIDKCNTFIQEKKPWEVRSPQRVNEERGSSSNSESNSKKILYELANAIKDFTILLSPFIPETAEKIAETFNFDISVKSLKETLKVKDIKKSEILFKKIDLEQPHESIGKTISKDIHKVIDTIKDKINKPIHPKSIEGVINMDQIKFDDFAKLDLRIATIKKVEDIEGADKLYKLEIDLGKEKRTICAGIKQFYKKDELIGKQIVLVANLEPRKMRGIESKGMLLAASSEDHSSVVLISPDKKVSPGFKVS